MSTQGITVRKLEVPEATPLPRHWFYGSPVHTTLVDALCLLFPEGERFFIRSVRHFADRLTSPELVAQVKAFAAQEAWHGRAHLQIAELLDAQGFDTKPVLERFKRLGFEVVEPRFSPELRLATTAAAEHFTATLAELALGAPPVGLELGAPLLDGVEQPMRDLLRWHAVEELEHRAVAFDVLQAVDPRWRTRAAGMAIAVATLTSFWLLGFMALRRQARALDGRPHVTAPPPDATRSQRLRRRPLFTLAHVARSIGDYLRPRFHPSDRPLPAGFATWSPGVLNVVQNPAGAA